MYDYLIVGAGFTGCTLAERISSQLGKKVLIIEKRNHIGGNSYDYYNEDGVLVSKYGAHIFHTNDGEIWKYVNRFSAFNNYIHTVDANVGGKFYSLPLNLDTINYFFQTKLTKAELPGFLSKLKVPLKNISNAEEAVINKVGWELYEVFYKNYTIKQWGTDPKNLDASVTNRLPIRLDTDKRYFTDKYQGIPIKGYTALFEKMISHRNIEILLNTDYRDILKDVHFKKLIFTGPIDVYFDKIYGSLPYRSIEFKFERFEREYYQHTGVVNFPNEHDYTRIVEYKYLNQQKIDKTCISKEYPCWNVNEPYYPVPSESNKILYNKYKKEAAKLENVFFFGRLGTYRYYNMDQCIGQALSVFESIARSTKKEMYNYNKVLAG